jgi:hypothetical protein
VQTAIIGHEKLKVCTSPDGVVTVTAIVPHPGSPGTPGSGTTTDGGTGCNGPCPVIYNFKGSCDGVPQAHWDTCTGPPNCPPGQAYYTYQEVIPNDTQLTDHHYCGNPGNPGTPDVLGELLRRFSPAQAKGSLQPNGNPLPVNLDLYVMATAPDQPGGSMNVGGVQATVHFTEARYTWSFGDGFTIENSADPGGPYPTGHLHHPYAHPGDYTVTLTVEWHVTYDYTLGGQAVTGQDGGWIPQPGGAQTFTSHVVDAHAVLVH